jgi:hypothetical protein
MIEKGTTIKLDAGKIIEGVIADKISLSVMSKMPNSGSELRKFIQENSAFKKFEQDLIPKIESVKISFFELINKNDKPIVLSLADFKKYLDPTNDFKGFKIDGLSPETLGTTKQALIEGTLELIRKKLQQ